MSPEFETTIEGVAYRWRNLTPSEVLEGVELQQIHQGDSVALMAALAAFVVTRALIDCPHAHDLPVPTQIELFRAISQSATGTADGFIEKLRYAR